MAESGIQDESQSQIDTAPVQPKRTGLGKTGGWLWRKLSEAVAIVPGTNSFKERVTTLAYKEQDSLSAAVNYETVFADEDTRTLTRMIWGAITEVSSAKTWGTEIVRGICLIIAVMLFIAQLTVSFCALQLRFPNSAGIWYTIILALITIFIARYVIFFILIVIGLLFSELDWNVFPTSQVVARCLVTGFITVTLVSNAFLFSSHPAKVALNLRSVGFALQFSIAQGLLLILVAYVTLNIYEALRRWLHVVRRSENTHAVIVLNLVNVITILRQTDACTLPSRQREVVGSLEEVALCIERGLPHTVKQPVIFDGGFPYAKPLSAPEFDAWYTLNCREMAMSFREIQKWLAVPKEDTVRFAEKRLLSDLRNILNGNWDAIEHISANAIKQSPVWYSHITDWLRTLVVCLLPFALFRLFEKPLHITEPLHDYLVFGAFIWALLNLLAAIDPNYSTKITALKDITGLIQGGVKDKRP